MKIKTHQPLMANRQQITQQIANFWDQISPGWQRIWGDHIHHGYYDNQLVLLDKEKAQEKLIEKIIEHLPLSSADKILDAGCGMGGSAIYLAKHYGATVYGITLSEKQVAMATQVAQKNQLQNVSFQKEDALQLASFADESLDIVWSLESCEQFYDKPLFIQQVYRVLKPGGKLMLATWCSRDEEYEGELAKKYQKLCFAFDLPSLPTQNYYQQLLISENFTLTKTFDWSSYVKKSWDIGISHLRAYPLFQLIKVGSIRGLRFIKQIRLMRDAFQEDRVRYGVFYATKNRD